MKRYFATVLAVFLLLLVIALSRSSFVNKSNDIQIRSDLVNSDNATDDITWEVSTVATGLDIPWDIAVLPDKRLLVSERTGKLKIVNPITGEVAEAGELPVAVVSESGLTGIALHPKFTENSFVYLYYTYRSGGSLKNRVSRAKLINDKLEGEVVILNSIKGGQLHNGGRLRFGPDEMLYIPTGDAAMPLLAQNEQELEGKILRVRDDGSIPSDNPVTGSVIYSRGHRNPQGLAWHPLTEQLFSTEHGETAHDELNLIIANGNYGWSTARLGADDHNGFMAPVLGSKTETWAPSGFDFAGTAIWKLRNTALMAGLRSQSLFQLDIENGEVINKRVIIDGTYGRLRAVTAIGDGSFYVSTSNRDGRATPKDGDDKILLVKPVIK